MIEMARNFIGYGGSLPKVWIANRNEIARFWLEKYA
jgi:hypothetical protein